MAALRSLMSGRPVEMSGRFVDLVIDPPRVATTSGRCPPFYFGGLSEEAKACAAAGADVYLMWPDTPTAVAGVIGDMRARADALGRRLRFGWRSHVIVRETESEAREAARRLLSRLDPTVGRRIRGRSLDAASSGVARQAELRAEADDEGYVGPHLWTGIGQARSGAGAAIVGDPDQVLATLRRPRATPGWNRSSCPAIRTSTECDLFARHVLARMEHGPLDVAIQPVRRSLTSSDRLSRSSPEPDVLPDRLLEGVGVVGREERDDPPSDVHEEAHRLLGPAGVEVGPVLEVAGAPDAPVAPHRRQGEALERADRCVGDRLGPPGEVVARGSAPRCRCTRSGRPGRCSSGHWSTGPGRTVRPALTPPVAPGRGTGHNSGMKPLAVHHVSVNVPDIESGVAFYTETLGGTLRGDRPDLGIAGAWIDLGDQQLHLIEAPVPRNLGQHFAIRVGDLDSVVDELRSKGIEVADPVSVGTNRQTFIDDPAGNAVELHEVGRGPSLNEAGSAPADVAVVAATGPVASGAHRHGEPAAAAGAEPGWVESAAAPRAGGRRGAATGAEAGRRSGSRSQHPGERSDRHAQIGQHLQVLVGGPARGWSGSCPRSGR